MLISFKIRAKIKKAIIMISTFYFYLLTPNIIIALFCSQILSDFIFYHIKAQMLVKNKLSDQGSSHERN